MVYALPMYVCVSNTRVNASSTQTFQLFHVPIDVSTAPENLEKRFSAPRSYEHSLHLAGSDSEYVRSH